MKFRSTTAAAALVIGAMTMGTTVSHADAEPAQPAQSADISYSTKLIDQKIDEKDVKTVVSTLKNGTFELSEQEGATPEDPKTTLVNVKDKDGATVITFPLQFVNAGVEIPTTAEVKEDGKVLEVTPEKPAGFQPSAEPVAARPIIATEIASPVENQRAMSQFSSQFGISTAIGGFVGTAVGAIIGCIVTFVAGCVPGLVAGAGIGGILGTIAVGGPTLIAAGLELIQVIQAPDGTTKWAN
ncbi:hypothetical protein [Nocardia sp. NPDC127526]|uniref:hypothetical protein n=1 Tax=Nocardia sp. NPDC127526 TaxID=3345393 RepID=UPI00363E6308